jgi:hypothetical protein
MDHPDEETLILHYYGEGEDAIGVEAHLAGCESCRAAYADLERDMAALLDGLPAPERGEDYGLRVWQRLRGRLEVGRVVLFTPRRLVVWGSIAALIVVAFLVGRNPPRPKPALPAEPVSEQMRHQILLLDVVEHLERSQRTVIELVNAAGNGTVDISGQQHWAEDLIADNRLYRLACESAGEAPLASLLEELERTLLEISNSPPSLSRSEFSELSGRITEQGIVFKLRVVGAQLRDRETAAARDRARRTS